MLNRLLEKPDCRGESTKESSKSAKHLCWYYNCIFRLLKDQGRRAMGMEKQDAGYPEGKVLYM